MRLAFRPVAALALLALAGALAAPPARATTAVLYDGAAPGETPADQGFFIYLTHPRPPESATLAPHPSGGAVLDTLGAAVDYAGLYAPPSSLPVLGRTDGFTLTFTARLGDEDHALDSRAGFSALVLADDRMGIELAFWADEVWAQNDGLHDPAPGQGLFTHGEGAALDTTAGLVTYSVAVRGDRYALLADGAELLEGPLRRYQPDPRENPLASSYFLGNAVFLGDNTSRAGAAVLLAGVSLETPDPAPAPAPDQTPRAYLPMVP